LAKDERTGHGSKTAATFIPPFSAAKIKDFCQSVEFWKPMTAERERGRSTKFSSTPGRTTRNAM
jgi:hypothetical protein